MAKSISWQYIAGFFDGEGNIYLFRDSHRERARIQISQKKRYVLDKIKEFLKEQDIKSIIADYEYATPSLRINRKSEVLDFLKKVLPFLMVKKEEAQNTIKTIETSGGRDAIRLSEKIKMKELWHEGYVAKEIAEILNRPLRTISFYCYKGQKGNGRLIENKQWLNL